MTDLVPQWRVRVGLSLRNLFVGVRWDGMKIPRSMGGKSARVVGVTICPVPGAYLKIERALVNPDYVRVRRAWL